MDLKRSRSEILVNDDNNRNNRKHRDNRNHTTNMIQESQESMTQDSRKQLLMWDRYIRVPIPTQTAVRVLQRTNRPHGKSYLYNALFPNGNSSINTASIQMDEIMLLLEKDTLEDNLIMTSGKASMTSACKGAISNKFLAYISKSRHAFLVARIKGADYTSSTGPVSKDKSINNSNPMGQWYILGTLVLGNDILRFPTPLHKNSIIPNTKSNNPKVAKVLLLCSNMSFGQMILDSFESYLRDTGHYDAVSLWSLSSVYSFYVDKCQYAPIDVRSGHVFKARTRNGNSYAYPFFKGDKPANGYFLTKWLDSSK